MTVHRRRMAICLLFALLCAPGCGGGGSSGSTGGDGGLNVNVLWEHPQGAALVATGDDRPRQQSGGGGFGPELPASVQSVRFVFESQSGFRCCVSIDPGAVPVDPGSGQRSVLLPNLPPGSATLQVAGFPTSTAAAPAGNAETCATQPASAGAACAADLAQTPSFASEPQPVTIVQGTRSDAGDILVSALPFVVPGSLSPALNEIAQSPVAVRFTVADAVTGIDRESVGAAVDGDGSAALDLQPCDDATAAHCSEGGRLEVRGFTVERAPQALAPGPKRVDIEARNQAETRRFLDFSYVFRAAGVAPTETRTATPPARTATPTTEPADPTVTRTRATATATREPATATMRPSRTTSPTPTVEVSPTVTGTPAPTTIPSPEIGFIAAAPIAVSTGAEFLLSALIDGDALSDIVIVSPESKEMIVLLGSNISPSRFNPGTVVRFGTRLGIPALGDVDGDGELDLIVPDDAENGIWVLIGKGDGSFETPILREVGRGPVAAAITDLDQASNLDLAVVDRAEGDLLLLTNTGDSPPGFALRLTIPVERAPEVVLAADFNKDEQPDLAVLSEGDEPSQPLSVLLFDEILAGFPVFSPASIVLVGERARSLTAADVDNNGVPDLVLLSRPTTTGNSDLVIVPMGEGGVPGEPILTSITCPFVAGGSQCPGAALALGDFDQDGNADVAAALDDPRSSSSGDVIRVLAGRGDTSFVPATSAPIPRSARAVVVGDFNGDGLADIATVGRRDSVVQALINVTDVGAGSESP